MHINDDMVRRFFDQQCSEEEARLVADWLKDHPEISEQYYKESDWMNEMGEDMPSSGWDAIWDNVMSGIRRRRNIKRIAYVLTACTCMLVLCICISKPGKAPAGLLTQTQPVVTTDSIVLRNDSDTSLLRILPDGTSVILSPHSEVSYFPRQWKISRQLQMEGEVIFNVARDEKRPFIVYHENLSMQALGTIFSVSRLKVDKAVKVRLYEGKILVKPVMRNGHDILHTFTSYLLPGQELVIPLSTYVPRQHSFLQSEGGKLFNATKQKNKRPGIKVTGWYEFTSQPLGDVFTTLEILHGVHIYYKKATLDDLFFIGRFGPEDTIEDILGTIALLNDLKVKKRSDNEYYVIKKG